MSKHKDKKHIVATIKLSASRRPYYYQVVLWDSMEAFKDYFEIANDEHTLAMTCFEPWYVDDDTGNVYINPKLGEIHFVKNHWNINIIAHEVQHAVIHRMRLVWPPASLVISDEYTDAEEEVAYETGNWVENIHNFLWRHDPGDTTNPKPYHRMMFDIPRYTAKVKLPHGIKKYAKSKKHQYPLDGRYRSRRQYWAR